MSKKLRQPTTWISEIDEMTYEFTYQLVRKKGHTLTINGKEQVIRPGFLSSFIGIDEKFNFDKRMAYFVIDRNGPDVAVAGRFLRSGKNYVARPKWVIVFVILCGLVPIITLGGAIPIMIGMGGASACVAISKMETSTGLKVFLCILITIACWLVLLISGIGFSLLFN